MPRRDSRPQCRRHAAPAATVAMAPGSQTLRRFRSVAAWAALTGLLTAAAPATALQVLNARDGVAVVDQDEIEIIALEDAEIVLVETDRLN